MPRVQPRDTRLLILRGRADALCRADCDIYVCMYVCMCVCVYVCIYMYMYVCIYMYVDRCIGMYTQKRSYIRANMDQGYMTVDPSGKGWLALQGRLLYVCMYVCVCVYVCTRRHGCWSFGEWLMRFEGQTETNTYLCVRMCVYIHTNIHICNVFMHVYVYGYTRQGVWPV